MIAQFYFKQSVYYINEIIPQGSCLSLRALEEFQQKRLALFPCIETWMVPLLDKESIRLNLIGLLFLLN